MLPPRKRTIPITPDTELYGDLGFYGDALVFDVIFWAHREFGVEWGNFRLDDYAPGEMPILRPLAKLVGRMKRKGFYKSLKVRDLVSAIETKRWPE